MTKLAIATAALALTLTASAALAQAPAAGPAAWAQIPVARGPAMALAVEMAQTAVAACAANGYKVGAVVVDSAGVTRVELVGDGAQGRAADVAIRKAFTAVTFKKTSRAVGEDAKTDKALADRIAADPKLTTYAGAKLLMVDGTLIGAFAVGGAPGGNLDEACVDAALAKVGPRLK